MPRIVPQNPAFRTAALMLLLPAPAGLAAQEPRGDAPPSAASDVRDGAGLFSPEAARQARDDLAKLEREGKLAVLIETVEGFGGEPIREVLAGRARRWGHEGLYVLIDKADRRFDLTETAGARGSIDPAKKAAIRDAFLEGFKHRQFNEGLAKGVRAIQAAVAASPADRVRDRLAGGMGAEATTAAPPAAGRGAELVARGQPRLSLSGARRLIEAAEAKAAELGVKVNVAVVDDGGHLLGFARMDGARPAGATTAIAIAANAATSPDGSSAGSLPVVVDGQVVGAIGIKGGGPARDGEVAAAAVARFAADLKAEAATADRPKDRPAEKPLDKPAEAPADRF